MNRFGLLLALALAAVVPSPLLADTFTVDTTADDADESCTDGDCSLRDAITAANEHPGADRITFDIAGCGDVCTIQPMGRPLPPLNDDAGVVIDGYTQPGAARATAATPAVLIIELDGSLLPDDLLSFGIGIYSSANAVRGLVINRFPSSGIVIGEFLPTRSPSFNAISGNYIGTDPTGTLDLGNRYEGIFLGNGAFLNEIGGGVPSQRNVLSGNDHNGVAIQGIGTYGNVIIGNYIGVDVSGKAALGNGENGVWVYGETHDNIIGGTTVGQRNVIAGNSEANVRISGPGTIENEVIGNFIGTNAAGDAAIGPSVGVYVFNGALRNSIGGPLPDQGNLISGHEIGVLISGDSTRFNSVYGNWIGLNAAGDSAMPNRLAGIEIEASPGNLVGGPLYTQRNVISGNGGDGIRIAGVTAAGNGIAGNYVGTNPAGSSPIPNEGNGVLITEEAHGNTIGGDEPDEGNVISGNVLRGVLVSGSGVKDNVVSGNLIGLDAAGTAALGNQEVGVQLNQQAQDNRIGGTSVPERNVISGNGRGGILVTDDDTTNNSVQGNYIGADASGLGALGNDGSGIVIENGAKLNTVGGCDDGQHNVIGGNLGSGVSVGSKAEQNTLACNSIGVAADGSTALGNEAYGVSIGPEASGNEVGPSNRIAHNLQGGVHVFGDTSDGNAITRNGIYSNGDDVDPGIDLDAGANNDIAAPVITDVTLEPDTVFGTACAFCEVEVFASSQPDGEGEFFLGSAFADAGGNFSLARSPDPGPEPPPIFPNLTATATDPNGTSEFSPVYIVTALFTPTGTPAATATPTVTPPPTTCAGDCNRSGEVTVDELVTGVNIALGSAAVSACPALDVDGNDGVTIGELIQAVNAALSGC